MQRGLKWTAVSMLIGVAGSIACSSGEPEAAPHRTNESLGSVDPPREIPAPGAQAAATEDPDPSCGQAGQPCCGDVFGSCDTGLRCHPFTATCDMPCGFQGESCCRDVTGVGHCYGGSTCITMPPPTHCE